MLEFVKTLVRGPTSMMFQPIVVQEKLVGLVPTPMLWDTILENVFSDTVSGVDCVLQTERQVFTYTVQDGVAVPRGEGDWHDSNYDEYKRSVEVAAGTESFTANSPNYTLHLYPNDSFFDTFDYLASAIISPHAKGPLRTKT